MGDITTFILWVGGGIGVLFALYIAVRVASAAFFKSREQYERQRHEQR